MKKYVLAVWMTLGAVALSMNVQAAGLADKLAEGGADWLLGSWTGTSPEGESFTLTYAPVFDGQAASVHFKSAQMEMKGLIAVDPAMDEVKQFAVTSSGELVTGTWNEEGGELLLDVRWSESNGSYQQRTYAHQWIDAKTARVIVYDGPRWRSDTTRNEVTLKRAP